MASSGSTWRVHARRAGVTLRAAVSASACLLAASAWLFATEAAAAAAGPEPAPACGDDGCGDDVFLGIEAEDEPLLEFGALTIPELGPQPETEPQDEKEVRRCRRWRCCTKRWAAE